MTRGFVIVLILFMFYQHLNEKREQQYAFVREARSYDLLRRSGDALRPTLLDLIDRFQSKGSSGGEQQG